MKYNISLRRNCAGLLLLCLSALVIMVPAWTVQAQEKRAIKGELATCQVDITQFAVQESKSPSASKISPAAIKTHKPLLNQAGYFDRVSNLQPQQQVSVQLVYPKARAGEKIAIMVLDGGTLDNNKKDKVVQLGRDKKVMFNFQPAHDPGIYRIVLRKGVDTKVVQLWVGPEPLPVKN